MTTIAIKPCATKDLPELQDVATRAYDDHYAYLWHDGGAWYKERCFSEAALRAEMENPNSAFYLIYDHDEVAGFMKLNIDAPFENYNAQQAMELERLYLLDEALGKGIGKWAVDFAVQYGLEKNKQLVWLKAMDSSRSVEFYEQNDFVRCGTYELDFEMMKEMYRGMIVMKREIASGLS